MKPVKVVVVDDHKLFRDGLKLNLLDYSQTVSVIGEADSGENLYKLLENDIPDLLLLDYQLSDTNGIEIVTRLNAIEKFKSIKKIILSAHTSERFGVTCYDFVLQAFDAGANGYLIKNSTSEQIYTAIVEVMSGGCFALGESFNFKEISKFLLTDRNRLATFFSRQTRVCLTKREVETIELLSQGLLVKEIAQLMGITEDSVNSHKENIRAKVLQNFDINLRNTVEMVVWAIKNRLIII
jgi:two-component system, NarL family, response regulator DegU